MTKNVADSLEQLNEEQRNSGPGWIGVYGQDGKIYHLNITGEQLRYYWSEETP